MCGRVLWEGAGAGGHSGEKDGGRRSERVFTCLACETGRSILPSGVGGRIPRLTFAFTPTFFVDMFRSGVTTRLEDWCSDVHH